MANRPAELINIEIFLLFAHNILVNGVKCPDASQWSFMTKTKCNKTYPEYYCLFDENILQYVETCGNIVEYQRPGNKFVIQGGLDGKTCGHDRFQPIKFSTNGSSDCMFLKSNCVEEGQIINDKGNSTSDRTCHCDYTRGYAFVAEPKNRCYCSPGDEDCTCYKKPCKHSEIISPDYKCLRLVDWTGDFKCAKIEKPIMSTRPSLTTVTLQDYTESLARLSHYKEWIAGVGIIGVILIGVLFVCCMQVYGFFINFKSLNEKIQILDLAVKENINRDKLIKVEEELGVKEKSQEDYKKCLTANYKDIVTTIRHKKLVDNLMIRKVFSDSDKEEIEKCLGLQERVHKILEIILIRGNIAYKEFISALRLEDEYVKLADQIEQTNVTDVADVELRAMMLKLKQEHNDKILMKTRDTFEQHLKEWVKQDKYFVETKATLKVEEHLRSSNCVLLVGNSGSGKKSILRHIALHQWQEEGYDIVPIVLSPNEILSYYNSNIKQVFVVVDLCGPYVINNHVVDVWKSQIHEIIDIIDTDGQSDTQIQPLQKGPFKLLLSCDQKVYDDGIFEPLKELLSKYKIDISDYPLTENEICEMIQAYASYKAKFSMKDLKLDHKNVPMLCRLLRGKTTSEMKALFDSPFHFIEKDVTQMQKEDHLQYCILTICTLFDNEISSEWFTEIPPDKKNAIGAILGHPDLELTKEKMRRIQERLDNTEMTYLTKSGNVHQFVSEDIYNIVSVICGKHNKLSFIDHASVKFISERYRIENPNKNQGAHKIELNKTDSEMYFKRLLNDLTAGNTYSTFHNTQLRDDFYRREFCRFCKANEAVLKEILSDLKQSEVKEMSPQSHLITDDYDKLKRDDYFKYNKTSLPMIEAAWEGFPDIVRVLIDMKLDVNKIDSFGRSSTFVACMRGKTDVVKMLVENGANIHLRDFQGRSSIYAACSEGHEEIVEFLISMKADWSTCDKEDRTPLHIACEGGHKYTIEILLKHSTEEINKTDIRGRAPLLAAVFEGHRPIINLLIQNKASVNTCDVEGKSPLFISCEKRYRDIVEILLENGADTLKCDMHNQSPLFVACSEGNAQIVQLLLSKKLNIDQCDENGRTALFIACENGHKNIVKLLLEFNSGVNKCDIDNRSPLYVACKRGHIEIVKLLSKHNANLFLLNTWKLSPLFVASREGHADIVKFLISTNKDVLKCDDVDGSPLHIACEEGRLEIVELLLGERVIQLSKFLVNQLKKDNRSPLHVAAYGGHEAIVQILLNNNAFNNRDNNGHTPADLARNQGYHSIAELIDAFFRRKVPSLNS